MHTDRFERDVLIDAPVDVVWSVITEPEHIAGWFSDEVDLDLRPGGEATLTWKEHGAVKARVERVDPPRAFAFRWSTVRDEAPVPGRSTLVEFTLDPEASGTRLRVVETGFTSLDVPDEEKVATYKDHEGGWGAELGELVAHVGTLAGRSAR